MKRDDFKKRLLNKMIGDFFFLFHFIIVFLFFLFVFWRLKLLCVKKGKKKTAVVTFWPCVQCNIENISLLFHIYSLCW